MLYTKHVLNIATHVPLTNVHEFTTSELTIDMWEEWMMLIFIFFKFNFNVSQEITKLLMKVSFKNDDFEGWDWVS